MRRQVRRSVMAINGSSDDAEGNCCFVMDHKAEAGLDEPLLTNGRSGEVSDPECQIEEVPPALHGRNTTWVAVTTALLSLQLGWGLWLFPSDYARLGWCAHGVLITLALLTAYSGTLFTRLFMAVPGTVLFSDVGRKAAGSGGAALVSIIVYSLDATRCVILHLAAAQSLRHMWPSDQQPPLWQCGAAVLVGASILVQVRSMAEMSWVFMLGTGSQLIAIAIVAIELIYNPLPDRKTSWVEVNSGNYATAAVAVMNMVFAFGGQFAFTEIMGSMAKPRHFPRAVYVCTAIMSCLYGGLGTLGYWSRGNAINGIVVFSLPDGPRARVAAGCILLQATAQYLINVNVWAHNLLVIIARHGDKEGQHGAHEKFKCSTDHCRWRWLYVSIFIVTYSYGISISLPFFSTLVGLVTSVTYLACAYTLPAWFALKLIGRRLWAPERWLLYTLIPLSIAISMAGLWGSVVVLLQDLGGGGEGWSASSHSWGALSHM